MELSSPVNAKGPTAWRVRGPVSLSQHAAGCAPLSAYSLACRGPVSLSHQATGSAPLSGYTALCVGGPVNLS